ncbi:MAG: HD domain-containing protein [Candidatus Omnitrophica bacterium]|nr:HD domain-containing protein [Candidatus Omnitrophota bacterium]
MKKDHSIEALLEKLQKNIHFQNEKRMFSKVFGNFKWFITENNACMPDDFPQTFWLLTTKNQKKKKTSDFSEIMDFSAKKDKAEIFCYENKFGVCCPVIQGLRIYGYILLYDLTSMPPENLLDIFIALTDTILREVQKELELKRMYDAIRPRAIALSTVHTVHRLINSTLDINELLPRVARLTLQILRANRCSIKLVDSKKKTLLPKSTVDLRTKTAELRKVEIGKYAPGKAVKFGKIIRGKEYIATPLVDEEIIGVITVYNKIDKTPFNDFDEEIMQTLAEQAVIAIKNAQLYKQQEKMTEGSIKSIAAMLETRSPGSFLPDQAFLKLVNLIGKQMKMSEIELKYLEYAALLHDAGQIALPDKLMKKKGVLTGKEYDMIKEHPQKAAKFLKPLKLLKDVVPIILYHHENYDGTGYPAKLKGNDIPLGARIMGLVGAFDAMVSRKAYRKRKTLLEAINEIKVNSGKQFDPKVVESFMEVMKRKSVIIMLEKEFNGN